MLFKLINNIKVVLFITIFYLLLLTQILAITTAEKISIQEQRNILLDINKNVRKVIDIPIFSPKDNKNSKLKERGTQDNPVKKDCHIINNIKIKGSNTQEKQNISKIIKNKYAASCLTVKDIVGILSFINNYYISKGYITTIASIGGQNISSGTLLIKITDGIIGKFDIVDKKNIRKERVFGGLEGKRLNIRDLEQGIEHINKVQSNNASITILPAKKNGVSIVKIKNVPAKKPIRLAASFDNKGSEITGKNRIGATLFIDNPTSNNDIIQISYRRQLKNSFDTGKSLSRGINWIIPNNKSTFVISIDETKSSYTSNIGSGDRKLSFKNSALNTILSWNYNLFRNQSERLYHDIKLTNYQPKSYIEDLLLEVSSRKKSSIEYSLQYDSIMAGGVFGVTLEFTKGIDAFSSYSDPNNLPDDAPVALFFKNNFTANYRKNFLNNYSFSTSLVAQYSDDNLYPEQQISIGSGGSIPGFTKIFYNGDKGYHWTHSLSSRFKIFNIINNLVFSLSHGSVSLNASNEKNKIIAGVGVSLSSNWDKIGVNTLISTGRALKTINNNKEPNFIEVNFSYDF